MIKWILKLPDPHLYPLLSLYEFCVHNNTRYWHWNTKT